MTCCILIHVFIAVDNIYTLSLSRESGSIVVGDEMMELTATSLRDCMMKCNVYALWPCIAINWDGRKHICELVAYTLTPITLTPSNQPGKTGYRLK